MWARNVVFLGLCFVGFTALAASLWPEDRIAEPQTFHPELYQRAGFRTIVEQVDAEFREHWLSLHIEPTHRADELTLARRLSLGLAGTIPSLEEIRVLETRPANQRVQWWISRLLEDRRTADYLAERLGRAYVGTENGPFIVYRRRRFVLWLSDRLAENMPYDQLVRRLISDRGLWTSNPAVNFLTVTIDDSEEEQPDPISLAGRTARAFLGMRIDCLQCHDDRLGNIELGSAEQPRYGEQADFHQLAAFFAAARVSLLGIKDEREQEYRVKYLDEDEEQAVSPQVPFLAELVTDAATAREQLAHWITHQQNRAFARAAVNRVWALVFGRPLAEPIDDIPLHGPFPPGLEALAADFVEHNYDLHRLIRVIAATDVFQRASRAEFEVLPLHEDSWAVFPLARLRPEQVAGALIQACTLKTIDANSTIFAQLQRFAQQNDFIQRYGDMGEDEFDDRGGTVTQRLLMMNGDLVKEKTKQDLFNASTKIAQLAPDDQTAVETAYLSVLTRRPSAAEALHFERRLSETRSARRAEQLEDLYWVLLNSTEFSWNH